MKKSPLIVFLTDYGSKDPYAGILHGVIARLAPQIRTLDLSHGIEPQNILQAALTLQNSFSYFPSGSIFVCVVDPGVGSSRKLIAVKTRYYFFLAPDNGLLDPVLRDEKFMQIRSIENKKYFLPNPSSTFHGRDILAPAAAAIGINPKNFLKLGPIQKNWISLNLSRPKKTRHGIEGALVYFDHFGNGITNIKKDMKPASYWKRAKITVGKTSLGCAILNYSKSKGKLCALFNSSGYLEIAFPQGSAQKKLKSNVFIPIKVHP